jgi:alkylated DNA repair dioxygenase AlkB
MTSVHIDTGRSALLEVPMPKTEKNREFFEKCIDYVKDKLIHRPEIIVFNKVCHQNRWVGFFSDTSRGYRYSRKLMASQPLGDFLTRLLEMTNEIFGTSFNGILVNYYANGAENIGDHSDDEKGLHNGMVVALSLGAERKFRIRDKKTKKTVKEILTKDSTYLIMNGDFQKEFTHGIPAEKDITDWRCSFTFRNHSD